MFSTLPFPVLADQLMTYHSNSLSLLPSLSYCSLNVVSLAYKNIKVPYSGFGYLIPSKYQSMALGVVWDSQIFPQQQRDGYTTLTVMLRDQITLEESISFAKKIVKEHLNISEIPIVEKSYKAESAIPQYPVGYAEKIKQFKKHILDENYPLTIGGQAVSGVSVNDCIHHSKQLAKEWSASFFSNLLQKFNYESKVIQK